jgi:hypothetical protein
MRQPRGTDEPENVNWNHLWLLAVLYANNICLAGISCDNLLSARVRHDRSHLKEHQYFHESTLRNPHQVCRVIGSLPQASPAVGTRRNHSRLKHGIH